MAKPTAIVTFHFMPRTLVSVLSFAILSAITIGSLGSCTGYSMTGGPGPLVKDPLSVDVAPDFVPLKVNEIVVYPLEPAPGSSVPKDTAEGFTSALVKALQANSSVEVLNITDGERVQRAVDDTKNLPAFIGDRARNAAHAVSAQGVLYGYVQQFSLEPHSPVGFKLWLVNPASGSNLWTATFQATHQTLTDNLFRLPQAMKKGVRTTEPEIVINEGFRQAAVRLETLRSQVH